MSQVPGALWLYRVALRLVLALAWPLLWLKDAASGKARPPLERRLGRDLPPVEPGGVWIQAVSVGEVEVARRIVAELDRRSGGPGVFLTSTTATGLDLARRTVGGRSPVHPCPLDFGGAVRRVFEHVRPRLLVLVETELWPEMLHAAEARGVPVAVINARLSEASFERYHRVRGLLVPLLQPVRLVLAREDADARRFAELGIPEDRIRVTGNVKYDLERDETPLPWAEALRSWAAGRPVVVAGSTMEGEEASILDAVEHAGGFERLFLVLAPRHPERFDAAAQLLERRGVAYGRRSRFDGGPDPGDVFLLDTIGELARAYGPASVAFVGGSLVPTGGHNPLEPAVWGVPVLTGPHVHNFAEVYEEMTSGGGARVVADAGALARALSEWLTDAAAAEAAGRAALGVVESNRGATARTVAELDRLARLRGAS